MFNRRYLPAFTVTAAVLSVAAMGVTPAPALETDIALDRIDPAAEIMPVVVTRKNPLRFSATVTAYSSSPDETWGDPFITASGKRVFDGLVACPREFPFGTKFRIGGRTYSCFDRLHPKYDDRFDIWKSSKNEALAFGKRRLEVEVL